MFIWLSFQAIYLSLNLWVGLNIGLAQGGPRLRAWRATLRFEEKFAGRKERHSIAIKRLVRCSNRPNFCCTPKATFDFGVILKFCVYLFATQKRYFLLEKWYTAHQQNNKTICFFSVLVIKSMSALVSVVEGRKQACRFHQPFYFVCRFSIAS